MGAGLFGASAIFSFWPSADEAHHRPPSEPPPSALTGHRPPGLSEQRDLVFCLRLWPAIAQALRPRPASDIIAFPSIQHIKLGLALGPDRPAPWSRSGTLAGGL